MWKAPGICPDELEAWDWCWVYSGGCFRSSIPQLRHSDRCAHIFAARHSCPTAWEVLNKATQDANREGPKCPVGDPGSSESETAGRAPSGAKSGSQGSFFGDV